jgi:hypothetical protein
MWKKLMDWEWGGEGAAFEKVKLYNRKMNRKKRLSNKCTLLLTLMDNKMEERRKVFFLLLFRGE